MLNKNRLLIVLLLIAGTISAQTSQKAEKMLNEVSSKVKSYDNIVIEFSYTLENKAADMKQETRGEVSLKDEKYRLNLMGVTRLFDGKKLYSIIPEDEEVNISNFDPDESNGVSPSEMLTFYEKGYTYKMGEMKNMNGRMIQYIELMPKSSNAEVKKIVLGIDKQTKHIYSMRQIQKNDTEITITVNSFKMDQPLSKNLFTFNKDKYQGYYINKLD
jgi:outer membrane lipoprotein-sorting protein